MTRLSNFFFLRAAFAACLALFGAGTTAAAEYVPDTSYNNGLYTFGYFGHGGEVMMHNFVGRKSVRLSNGDIVIAGSVPAAYTNPETYTGHPRTLGLVRHNAAGQRVAWSNPGSAASGNDFVVRPTSADGTAITAVKDLVAWGDYLFVLAESQLNTSHRAMIYVFGTDGSYKAPYQVDAATSSERLVWGGGLAVNQATGMLPTPDPLLIYIGRKKASPSANERITFRRYSVSSAGALTAETSLTLLTHTECPSNIHCSAFGIAWGGGLGIGLIPRLYITGSRYGNGTWSAYWAQISATDGTISSFRYLGVPGARGRALAVRARYGASSTDDVFVAAEYDRNCKNGVLVSGRWQPSEPAGYFLTQVIGGFSTSPANPVCPDPLRTTMPTSIAYQNGRVAVAGYSYNRPSGAAEDNTDAWSVVLDANDLTPISPENATNPLLPVLYSWENATGTRIGHSGFHDIVASGNGTFTATGDVRYPIGYDEYGNFDTLQRFGSLRIAEQTELFADGFESSGGGGNNGSPSTGLSALGLGFFNKLYQSQQTRTLVGHQATSIAGVGWRHFECQNDCSDFRTSANNRHAAVAGWELESPGGVNSDFTFDGITYDLTFQEALKARNRGAINTFSMHTRRLDNAGGSWTVAPAGHCAQLLPGGAYHAQWNTKLTGYVTQLNKMQQGGQPVPFLFRPFHEADGNWFWWGTAGCSDASFKDLFRYTVQYMRNAGLTHMLVVYAPGIFTNQAQYLARYPGDDVVDVIGFDQYLQTPVDPNHGDTVAGLTTKLGIVHALAQARGKIAAWAETGQKGVATNNAYSQLAQAITNSGAKLAYVMFWANYTTADNDFYIPYPISPAAVRADFNGFIAAPRVAAGEFPSVYP